MVVNYGEWCRGTFLREHKTRFLCDVEIEGIEKECYVPASCKFSNFIDLTGKEVLLSPIEKKESRTDFAIQAVKIDEEYILLNLAEVNRIVQEQLYRRYFSFLGQRKTVSRETRIEDYKTDLFIEDSKTIIEVKTLLSFDKEGSFPSMKSDRAEKQLEKIEKLLDKGYRVCYLIISLNPDIKRIHLNNEMERYYYLFNRCMEKGLLCKSFSIRLRNMEAEIFRRIDLITK